MESDKWIPVMSRMVLTKCTLLLQSLFLSSR